MKTLAPWLYALLGQFLEGVADAFLALMGGNTAAQFTATALPAVSLKQLALSCALLGAIYVASFVKKNPLPLLAPPAPVSTP